MDISVRTGRTLVNEDQRWMTGATLNMLRSSTRTVTLDRSAFDLVTAFPNGVIPSGVVLAQITATGLYAPYSDVGTGGLSTAVGFLAVSVPYDRVSLATSDLIAALLWKGEVVTSFLPTGNGLDANGRTDLAAKFALI